MTDPTHFYYNRPRKKWLFGNLESDLLVTTEGVTFYPSSPVYSVDNWRESPLYWEAVAYLRALNSLREGIYPFSEVNTYNGPKEWTTIPPTDYHTSDQRNWPTYSVRHRSGFTAQVRVEDVFDPAGDQQPEPATVAGQDTIPTWDEWQRDYLTLPSETLYQLFKSLAQTDTAFRALLRLAPCPQHGECIPHFEQWVKRMVKLETLLKEWFDA